MKNVTPRMKAAKAKLVNVRTSNLKSALKLLQNDHYNEMRQAYFKAAEGLAALQSLLGEADDHQNGFGDELRHVTDAKNNFERGDLGKVI